MSHTVLRIGFFLPGLHRVTRGAEVAFESLAHALASRSDCSVTLFGSGKPRNDVPYRFVPTPSVDRAWFYRCPSVPLFRTPYMYEEASFVPALLSRYDPNDYDVTITCSFPYLNLLLSRRGGRYRPTHVFVTQNGDWPLQTDRREYGFFDCDGLICTNPDYYRQHSSSWPATLIPNGVNPQLFAPGTADRARFGLPQGRPVALMVSALTESKRIFDAIRYAARVPDVYLLIVGEGPLRDQIRSYGQKLMPGRFDQRSLARSDMPEVYRAADVFLHMSLTEPSANAYTEALATGLPIVTHDRDVTRWTLEDNAWLVDTTEDDQVVAAIRRALESSGDRDHITRCRSLVDRRYDWQMIAEQYLQFIRSLTPAATAASSDFAVEGVG